MIHFLRRSSLSAAGDGGPVEAVALSGWRSLRATSLTSNEGLKQTSPHQRAAMCALLFDVARRLSASWWVLSALKGSAEWCELPQPLNSDGGGKKKTPTRTLSRATPLWHFNLSYLSYAKDFISVCVLEKNVMLMRSWWVLVLLKAKVKGRRPLTRRSNDTQPQPRRPSVRLSSLPSVQLQPEGLSRSFFPQAAAGLNNADVQMLLNEKQNFFTVHQSCSI